MLNLEGDTISCPLSRCKVAIGQEGATCDWTPHDPRTIRLCWLMQALHVHERDSHESHVCCPSLFLDHLRIRGGSVEDPWRIRRGSLALQLSAIPSQKVSIGASHRIILGVHEN